jgi:hypothetical protein
VSSEISQFAIEGVSIIRGQEAANVILQDEKTRNKKIFFLSKI